MKHSLLVGALLLGSAGAATAQITEVNTPAATATTDSAKHPLRLSVGVAAGATYTTFGGSDASTLRSSRYKWGYHAGLTADIRFGEHLAFHPEVLYTLKGSDFADQIFNRDLTYLEVPLLLRFYGSESPKANTLFLEAGPQASLLLTAKNEAKADVKSEFHSINADFILGAGYRFANGVSLGVRYDIGLTNLYHKVRSSESQGRGYYQSNANTDAFLLSVGYSFSTK